MSDREWISGAEAARILGTQYRKVLLMARQGHISTRRLPGHYVQYSRTDAQRLAAEAVTPARSEAEADLMKAS